MSRDRLTVIGGNTVLFGDPHFSDIYTGSHKDYMKQSYFLMQRYWDIVTNEQKNVTCVVFLGDIFGVREQRLRSREYLSDVIKFFQRLNSKVRSNAKKLGGNATNGVVACVKGNHDMSPSFTDFDFFVDQGLFVNPESIDIENAVTGETELRMHFVNWGDEDTELDIIESGSNLVLGHGEYSIPDLSIYLPPSANTRVVSKMANFNGVDFLISGHIHMPSPAFEFGRTSNGGEIGLFYPGSPARVAERIDEVFYVSLSCSKEGTDLSNHNMGLNPAEEIFIPKDEELDGSELVGVDEEYEERNEKLKGILEEVISHRVSQGDLNEQIFKIPHVSTEAKNLATEYLQKVEDR